MPPLAIRRATAADCDRYFDAFERVAAEGRWMGAEAPLDRMARRPFFDQGVAGEGAVLFLALLGDEIIGALNASGSRVVDIGMFVVGEHRGSGVGAALMDAGIGWARDEGAQKVSLEVWATNYPAQALYSRFGFFVEGRRRRHYQRRNGELRDSLMMGLLLDGPAAALPLPADGLDAGGGLKLRPWRRADIPELVAAATDPLIGRWLSMIPQPYTADHGAAFVAAAARGLTEGNAADLAVLLDGRLAGAVGLRLDPNDPHLASIGYWTAAAARRRGVATRAVRAIAAWGAEAVGARRIEIYAGVENLGPRAVAEAAGFELEAILRSWRVEEGKPVDYALYAFLPSG